MRSFLNGLVLGLIVGAGAVWFYTDTRTMPAVQEAQRAAREQASRALESAQVAAERARQALAARLDAFELSAEDIRKDVAENGKVVRQRVRELGDAVVDATADARITAAVKARLAADPELSVLDISVDSTAGRVTLAGTVATPDLIGKAMVLALDTEGVRTVVSTLQVK
jgi:osmotically-inducible protein OsmY